MLNKLDVRINKIRSERYELLSFVSDSIKNNGKIVFSDIKSVMDVIDYDEKCVKRYEAIVKAQNLIVSLTEEITFANSEIEITSLRKKLNYYINKVKNELKKRNVSEEYINKYSESTSYLRKDIAKYIRILKRENNLLKINDIYANYDKLTEEEKIEFKKSLSRESRYNHRNLNSKESKKRENKIVSNKEETNNMNIYQSMLAEINSQEPTAIDSQIEDMQIYQEMIPKPKTENRVLRVVESIKDVNYEDIQYLDLKIKSYDRQYNIHTLYDYNKSFIKRVCSMLKNIPLYKENKKNIKTMESDSQKYYGGSDLISYIAYLTRINSIKHGLKSVFDKSYLYKEETKLLNDHEKCAEWLLDYCNKNSLGVKFLTRTKVVS